MIPPKGKKKRIVYLGESVARGFFFDPYYTPAKVLEAMLEPRLSGGAEVVDLAAHDLGAPELINLPSERSTRSESATTTNALPME